MSIRDFMAPGLSPTFKVNLTGQVIRPALVYEPSGDDHGTDIFILRDGVISPAVIVDRERLERLINVSGEAYAGTFENIVKASRALKPGDLDPLP